MYGGWFGSGNLGDQAILMGVKALLEPRIKNLRLTALSSNPQLTTRATGLEAVKLESPKALMRKGGKYLKTLVDADAHILTGGTPFYDYGHISRVIHMATPGLANIRVIGLGVGCKPIESLVGREATRLVLRNMVWLTTRDRFSYEALKPFLGRQAPHFQVTGDSALVLRPPRVGPRKPRVVFCPRRLSPDYKRLYHQELGQAAINKARRMQGLAADALIREGYEVCFAPLHRVPPDDDLGEIRLIQGYMKEDALVLPRPASVAEALRLFGSSTLVVGLRLHSLVLAARVGTPFTSINYDPKIEGFARNLGVEGLVTPLGGGLHALEDSAWRVLEKWEEVAHAITKGAARARERIEGDADNLARSLPRILPGRIS